MDTTKQLLAEFQSAMLATYDAARRLRPPYHPTIFRQMVLDHGGKGAADILLAGSAPSQGFNELYLRGPENLRLSAEYLALTPRWQPLFTPRQLETARRRLLEVGANLPPGVDRDAPFSPVEIPLPGGFPAREVDALLPEELPVGEVYPEGFVRQITVNAYERSAQARTACIAHYGPVCIVCGFSFERMYGPDAAGHIHVHHLQPVSSAKQAHEVDPVRDLRPVCANCHSVIHLGGVCRSIDQVKAMLARTE